MKNVWILSGILLFGLVAQAQRSVMIDSLKYILDNTENQEKKLRMYNQLSLNYWRISADSSVYYGRKALELAELQNDTIEQAKAHYHTGIAHVYRGEFDQAIFNMNRSLTLTTRAADSLGMAKAYGGLAFTYKRLEIFEKALENYLKALKITEQIKDVVSEAYMLNNIGNIHYSMNNYDLSLNYYSRALNKLELIGDKTGITFALNNIGNVYKDLGNFDSAMYYYNNSLILKVELNDTWGAASSLHNMGKVAYSLRSYRLAAEYFQQATELMKEAGDKFKYTESAIELGKTLVKLKNYDRAKSRLDECTQLVRELGSSQLTLELYHGFADYYQATGNFRESNTYLERIIDLNDSLKKEEISTRIAEVQNVYELEKKDQQIQVLKKDNLINQLRIKRKDTLRNFLIVIALTFLILGFMIYREYRKKNIAHRKIKKINKELEEQKVHISKQNEEITLQRDELQKLNNTKDKLFSIISHDLKSPFNALLGFAYLLNTDYKEMSEEERREIIGYINQAINDTYALTQNLLYWARSQTGGIKLKQSEFDLNVLLQEIADTLKPSADKKDINLILENEEPLQINADRNLLDIVVRNLVSNAIKFTEDGGKVSIAYYTGNSNIKILVEDTGVGIDEDKIEKLFDAGANTSTKGTREESGTGLGLVVCKEFVEMHGGSLQLKSQPGKGTTAFITLPAVTTE